MSSKKKKSGKKKNNKEKKSDAEPDEFDEMEYDQLQEEVKRMTAKLTEIRRDRNYYQLERDQIQQNYDIVRDEVVKTESHIRNIESQMERMQDTHRNDIRIYAQKVIHLQYEHQNNIEAINTLGERDRQTEEQLHKTKKSEMKTLKQSLKEQVRKEDLVNEEEIRRQKEIERKEMAKLREQFERAHQELQQGYEQRLQQLRDDLELRRKMEIHEIEERKNRHINDLMLNHEKNFQEMRNYYNSITQDNLELIKELNNEIEDLKVAHMQNEKAMEQIEKKNETLSEPLQEAEAKVIALRYKLTNYQKDKASLQHAKARLHQLEEHYKSLQQGHLHLQTQYKHIEYERDHLYSTFEQTVLAAQRKSQAKNVALERQLEELKEIFEMKKAQFTSVLRASNLDPIVLQNVTKKLDDVLSSKNEQIQELKYEVAKITKSHNDLVRVYDAKLAKMGIKADELHLEPLIGYSNTQPADLIIS